jgi:hypothetical protein
LLQTGEIAESPEKDVNCLKSCANSEEKPIAVGKPNPCFREEDIYPKEEEKAYLSFDERPIGRGNNNLFKEEDMYPKEGEEKIERVVKKAAARKPFLKKKGKNEENFEENKEDLGEKANSLAEKLCLSEVKLVLSNEQPCNLVEKPLEMTKPTVEFSLDVTENSIPTSIFSLKNCLST